VEGTDFLSLHPALLAHHAAGRVQVRSAGSAPAQETNPAVMAAMAKSAWTLR
jgi:protein-tyrosine-phosphatase